MNIKYSLAILLLTLMACTKDQLAPRQLVSWVEDEGNGLNVDRVLSPYHYAIQYKPVDYIIAKEERQDRLPDELVTRKRSELGESMEYFNFKISMEKEIKNVLLETAANESEYYEIIDYLSYHAQKDFYMIQGSDTSKCLLYQFVRNYDLAPYLEFVLAFERQGSQDRVFVYEDQTFGSGIVKAQFKQQKINRIPELKFDVK